jgi:hypothetical protein
VFTKQLWFRHCKLGQNQLWFRHHSQGQGHMSSKQLWFRHHSQVQVSTNTTHSDLATGNKDICHQPQLTLNQGCAWRLIFLFLVAKSELYLVTYISVSSTKHNYDLATRNRNMCHQTQLWFSHQKQGYMSPSTTLIYPLETRIYVTKHNSDLATRNRNLSRQTQLWLTH